jgi:hypothetical protein
MISFLPVESQDSMGQILGKGQGLFGVYRSGFSSTSSLQVGYVSVTSAGYVIRFKTMRMLPIRAHSYK